MSFELIELLASLLCMMAAETFGQSSLFKCDHYRIVLIFRGSKFSRIAVLKEFVERNLRMHVAMHVTVQGLKF